MIIAVPLLNERLFNQITCLQDVINAINNGLIRLCYDFIYDIDRFMEQLITKYGENFSPEENEDVWYEYDNENVNGVGANGCAVYAYFENYKSNLKNVKLFLEKLSEITDDDVEKITLVESETDYCFYDDELARLERNF